MRGIALIALIALSGCTATIAPVQQDADLREAVANHERVLQDIVSQLNPILKERQEKAKNGK